MASTQAKGIAIRLVCTSMPQTPAVEGPLDVGIQDKAQVVHPGRVHKDGTTVFECTVEARIGAAIDEVSFRGPFVHGTPEARFLYLSWKRKTPSAALWCWRVKVPLAGITGRQISSLKSDETLEADITGRRPHATEPVVWKRGFARAA